MVSIHAPAWGATASGAAKLVQIARFNPRARVGRDVADLGDVLKGKQFQSTRPRGARQGVPLSDAAATHVSIHAPAWGATLAEITRPDGSTGFNPRARVGRDGIASWLADECLKFQSTRPRGARRAGPASRQRSLSVSIHAPAWGATTPCAARCLRRFCFNPRARVGRDSLIITH